MTKDELIKQMHMLPPTHMENMCGLWEQNIRAMRGHVYTEDIDHFLTWSTVVATMFTGYNGFTDREYREIAQRPDARWMHAIRESWIGLPPAFDLDHNTSGNLVHQAYHMHTWSEFAREISSVPTIVEFGGGYGSLAYVARRLGFEGMYVIFDIPEMLLLQEYYLSNTVGKEKVFFIPSDNWTGFQLKGILQDALVIGMWSLSEAPISIREQFLGMDGKPQSYLFAFQDNWNEINNDSYFNHFAWLHNQYNWYSRQAADSDHYLIGIGQ
jgi:hypothetical protein